jgi:hypothetical protein
MHLGSSLDTIYMMWGNQLVVRGWGGTKNPHHQDRSVRK